MNTNKKSTHWMLTTINYESIDEYEFVCVWRCICLDECLVILHYSNNLIFISFAMSSMRMCVMWVYVAAGIIYAKLSQIYISDDIWHIVLNLEKLSIYRQQQISLHVFVYFSYEFNIRMRKGFHWIITWS